MSKFGDFLGLILAEFTRARMNADIESVRIAKIYAGDPLLRNMPIPHFRLPNIEVDMPVVISEAEEVGPEESVPTINNLPELQKTFEKSLSKQLRDKGITVSAAHKKKLNLAISKKFKALKLPRDVPLDIDYIAEIFSDEASRSLVEAGYRIDAEGPTREKRFKEKLKKEVRKEFLKSYRPLPRLHILSKTAEIREAGPDEVVTRIHMKISEEGFELTKIETEGEFKDILVPE
ncbi:MAG: hypothetical protein V3V99_04580 [candidate division Zixibacteria bacterium]